MCLKVWFILNFLLTFNYQNMAASCCNEENCGSIVSKCFLTESCKCDRKDSSCYNNCFRCMGRKYFKDCCGCFDLCPKAGNIQSSLSHKSHVEDFEGVPELFDILFSSSVKDLQNNWNILKFTVNYETFTSNFDLKPKQNLSRTTSKKIDINAMKNCTVAYFEHCLSWNKCRQTCRSTGASSYRWFHDGCCECVGSTCLNYGLNESRCKFCPEEDDEEFDDGFFDEVNFYELNILDENLEDNFFSWE